MITGVGAVVNTAGLRPGQSVVVIGAGGVGLNAIQGARIAGASRIIAVDMTEDKLEAALRIRRHRRRAGHRCRTLGRRSRKLTGRGADACSSPSARSRPMTPRRATCAPAAGSTWSGCRIPAQMSSYEPVIIAALDQGMIGSKMGDTVLPRDIPWMVDLYGQRRLKLDELISGRWSLDQINEAIADTKGGHARRNVIVFWRPGRSGVGREPRLPQSSAPSQSEEAANPACSRPPSRPCR